MLLNRRHCLALLAGLPFVGRFVPKAAARYSLSKLPPPVGTPTVNIWWYIATWWGDQWGVAGPGTATMWLGPDKWVTLAPGARWRASEVDGFTVDGFKIAECPYV